jgi:hypothetical protein
MYNCKNLFLVLVGAIFSTAIFAQISHGGAPINWEDATYQPEFEIKNMPGVDLATLAAEDAVTDQYKEAPWRFGVEQEVAFNLENSGTWSFEEGVHVWRLGFNCPDALNISFMLSKFILPKEAELFVYNAQRTAFLGSFTLENNKEWEGLSLGVLDGASMVLEYHESPASHGMGEIEVNQVIHGYRSLLNHQDAVLAEMADRMGPFGNSGACNINVNCPEGADWQTEKRSVALIVNGGSAWCTGSLVNNTAEDETPYFLTANHCLGNPSSWVYYFNHESSSCSGSTGTTNQSVSGGSLLVSSSGSDYALIELSSTPPASYNVEYAGWDNSGIQPSSAVGIHHPSGDVKKICFENDQPYQATSGSAQVWYIDQWELGVTEPGSSGSPLFDQNHRIIGQLYGGYAACSGSVNNGQADWYGRFNVSWGLGASQYLDPLNTGASTLDSYPTNSVPGAGCMNPSACNYDPTATTDNGTCVYDDVCGECGGDGSACTGCTDPASCNYDPSATIDDGSCIGNGVDITFTILTDNYPGETTWNVTDASGATIMSGGPYSGSATTYTQTACVESGCYDVTINDTYGDGICCSYGVGNYTITSQGNTLVSGGEFTSVETTNFCVTAGNTTGCTDNTACNYDPTATVDDGSCESTSCAGCTNSAACNYDSTATIDDGSCESTSCAGCTNSAACNYDSTATIDDGSCDYNSCAGCTDSAACNYDSTATIDDGSCESTSCAGCTDSTACNYDSTSTIDDGSCEFTSCACTGDVNGDGNITVADVLLVLSEFGCMSGCTADVDGDGYVNVSDLLLLLSMFGTVC